MISKITPELSAQVEQLRWDSSEKELKLILKETSEFHVYKWIKEVRRHYVEIKKGPFHHSDEEVLTLEFMNDDKLISRIKLHHIEIKRHHCDLKSNFKTLLRHKIVISYNEEKLEQI